MINALTFRTSLSRQATAIAGATVSRLNKVPSYLSTTNKHTQIRILLNVCKLLTEY